MILNIVLGILVLVLGFLYYKQDRSIKAQIDYIDNLENKLVDTVNKIDTYNERMKEIDSKGGFQSDDEVGQIFAGVKETLEELVENVKGEISE